MPVHNLKTWPDYYRAVASGQKPFEIRLNDRGYQLGDILHLQEWEPSKHAYTGDSVHCRVTYIMAPVRDSFGVKAGYALMGIRVMDGVQA